MAIFAADGVIPKYGVSDRVDVVKAMAKTGLGKINKKQLGEDYE